jgi:ribosomal-protein-alanine N-acetyltransferase
MSASRIELRPAAASDLAAIFALESATDGAPHWPQATYEAILDEQLAAGQRCLILAETDAALAGFAVGLMHRIPTTDRDDLDDRVAELESVMVASSARRAGTGRALCCAVLDWCRSNRATEVVLEVRSGSAGAIALYAGLGFTQAGRRPRYYRDPDEDALILRLPLDRSGPQRI